jgi:16S rRNA (adenine1518-N6/adenine1519-N6)-dimethyltransferase
MQTLSDIRRLLAERGIVPRRRFGQNFLHEKNLINKLLAASGIATGDLVLEVGPGTGALTEALLEAGAVVIACEIDRDLAALVRERLGERVTLIEGDALDGRGRLHPAVIAAIDGRPFKLIANLPYNMASALIVSLLADGHPCDGLFVTIQREVADRLLAPPRTKTYGALTVIVRTTAEVARIATLAPSCFWPAPEVESAMVSIIPKDTRDLDPRALMRFAVDLFSKRRKQLRSILGPDVTWPEGVEPSMRPEALEPGKMVELWRVAGG